MRVPPSILDGLAAHARDSDPRECCGLLLASGAEDDTVSLVIRAENAELDQPQQRYSLGHRAHLQAVALEAEDAARIVGYYHSHPRGRATPSAHDVREAVEGATYLIIGLGGGSAEYAAWRLSGGEVIREPLEVIGEQEHTHVS
jgi:proteasome lid subunit RPN8/RPN11